MSFNRHNIFSLRAAAPAVFLLLALLVPGSQLDAAPAKAGKGKAAKAAASTTPAATSATGERKKEFSDLAATALAKIIPLLQPQEGEPQLDAALAAIEEVIHQVDPESYDMAYLSLLKAQANFMKQDNASVLAGIAPLETTLRLSEQHGYFGKTADLGYLWMLAQLYTMEASNESSSGKNSVLIQQKYTKALNALRRWISLAPKANFEAYMYIASILFQMATEDPEKPKMNLLKEAEEACHNALLMAIKPNDRVYQLLIAIAHFKSDYVTMAKYLELMVEINPKSERWWNMLFFAYHSSIEATPAGSFLRDQAYAMAVHTLNRAQQNGFMMSPADYFNKAVMYLNSEQYQGAADLLRDGLREGKIDRKEYKNWEALAQTYHWHLGETRKAIDTYRESQKIPEFANDGNIDLQIASLYFYVLHQYRPALEAILAASKKKVPPKKEAGLYSFMAYIYLSMMEYEKGMEAVKKSLELSPEDRDALQIKRALEESIDEQDRILRRGKYAPEQQQQNQQPQPQVQTSPAK